MSDKLKLPYPTLADKTVVERKGDNDLDRQVGSVLDVPPAEQDEPAAGEDKPAQGG